jgi:NADH-quinone oxidoreductase subunit M
MSDFPWLTAIAVVPLLGAGVLAMLPREATEAAKRTAFGISLVPLVLTIAMALQFDADGSGFQFAEVYSWIPAFGADYAVGVDGIALVLIALTTILVPIVILAGWNDADAGPGSVKGYFALVLALQGLVLGVFSATDLFLFYVLFEAMLLPMYFLIGRYGGPNRQYAAVKFLLFSLLGGLVLLAALIGLYVVSGRELGAGTFEFAALTQLNMDPATQKLLFLGFFFAFAIKAPLWPLHTWLPTAAAEGTPASAVLLVSAMDKVGTFAMLRYLIPIFPEASVYYTPLVIALSLIGIVYGALVAIGQTDMQRLIAYTSVSHFGFIALGIFAMTTYGQSGSTLYMVNHGFSTAALFLVAGFLITRRGSKLIADFGGVQRVAPLLAGTFLIAGLSSLALPGLSSFVSEFMVLVGTYVRYPWIAAIATVGIILAALYILQMVKKVNTGPAVAAVASFRDLSLREVLVVAPLIAGIVGLGFYPAPLLDVINPAIEQTLQYVDVTDPEPTVPLAEGSVAP